MTNNKSADNKFKCHVLCFTWALCQSFTLFIYTVLACVYYDKFRTTQINTYCSYQRERIWPTTHVALPFSFRADLWSEGTESSVPASDVSNISNTTGALSVLRVLFPTASGLSSLPSLPSLYIIRSLVASSLRSILRVMTFIDPPCALAATRRKSMGGSENGGVVPRDLEHQRHQFYLFVSRAQRVGLFCLPPPALSAARFPLVLSPPGTSLFRMHVFSSFGFSLSFSLSLSLFLSFLFSLTHSAAGSLRV